MNAASPWLLFLLEVAGEGRLTTPDDGLSRELRLARGLAELQARPPGPALARLRLEPVRSGGESGYVGVAGESIVPRVQVAEAGLVAAPFGRVRVVAGLVDDPWVRAAEEAWDLPAVAAALPEGEGLMARSDLGAAASWESPGRHLSLTTSLLSGEGLDRRERNEGQDLQAMLALRPLADADPRRLELSLMARDGSRGVDLARDHRLGLRVQGEQRWLHAGAEGLLGWGLDADPAQRPAGASAWARQGPALPAVAWLRVDHARAQVDDPRTATTTLRLGGGPGLGGRRDRQAAWLALGIEHVRHAENAAAIAGAGAAANQTTVLLQLGVRLRDEPSLP